MHLLGDLRRGQLTHTDSHAFRLGENIAVTPGKVVHETPMFQLIQYSPTTDKVLAVPLLVFGLNLTVQQAAPLSLLAVGVAAAVMLLVSAGLKTLRGKAEA